MSQGTLIGIDQLVLGATTACDLKDLDGRVAITTGTPITPQLLKRIKAAGMIGLIAGRPDYTTHLVSPGRPTIQVIASRISEMQRRSGISGPLSSPVTRFARKLLGDTFSRIASGGLPDIPSLETLVRRILHETELLNIAPMPSPRSSHDSIIDRLVDGAIEMAVLMGWHMRRSGENEEVIKAATLGALLHDAGFVLVSQNALVGNGPLLPPARLEIRRHPYLALRSLSPLGDAIPKPAQDVILLHHEREDGKGYPLKRSGDQVPEVAKLAHIIDAYTALVSPRPHRRQCTPHQAVSSLLRDSGTHFNKQTLRRFIERTGRYPLGSAVMLSSNEVGVVVGIGKGGPFRPVVDVYFSRHAQFSQTPQRVDLGGDDFRYVRHVMK